MHRREKKEFLCRSGATKPTGSRQRRGKSSQPGHQESGKLKEGGALCEKKSSYETLQQFGDDSGRYEGLLAQLERWARRKEIVGEEGSVESPPFRSGTGTPGETHRRGPRTFHSGSHLEGKRFKNPKSNARVSLRKKPSHTLSGKGEIHRNPDSA